MAQPPAQTPRDPMFRILNAFDPNDELPEEFDSRLSRHRDQNLDEVANLRGHYYSLFATILRQTAQQNPALRGQLEQAVPERFWQLDLARRRVAREVHQHERFLAGATAGATEDGTWLDGRLRAYVDEVQQVALNPTTGARFDQTTAIFAVGILLRAIQATVALHDNACARHLNMLLSMVEGVQGFPEDVRLENRQAIHELIGRLYGMGDAENQVAERLAAAVHMRLQGVAAGSSTSGGAQARAPSVQMHEAEGGVEEEEEGDEGMVQQGRQGQGDEAEVELEQEEQRGEASSSAAGRASSRRGAAGTRASRRLRG